MNKIDIAVGQVWRRTKDADEISIEALDDKRVCCRYGVAGIGCFNREDLLENYKLIRHQNGADIDEEKYTYAIGDDDAPVWWNTKRGWSDRGEFPNTSSFTRTPKKPAEPELPYVDCEVYEDDNDLCFVNPEGYERTLSRAVDDKRFIGYMYASGNVIIHDRLLDFFSEKPASFPTHVRFAK